MLARDECMLTAYVITLGLILGVLGALGLWHAFFTNEP